MRFLHEIINEPEKSFDTYKKISIASVSTLTLIFLTSFISIGFGDGYFKEPICGTRECQRAFIDGFRIPFLILDYGLKICGAAIALGGLLVAVGGYIANYKLACTQIHHQNLIAFKEFISKESRKNRILTENLINSDTWYSFATPNSRNGDLQPADNYKSKIRKIKSLVGRVNSIITRVGRGYRHSHYLSSLSKELTPLGIEIHDIDRFEFYTLENEVFSMINKVNKTFFPNEDIQNIDKSNLSKIPWD